MNIPTAFATALTSACLLGCATPPAAPLRANTGTNEPRHVYRLDFVLAVADGSADPTTTSFMLNLPEIETGEISVGKNIPLAPAAGNSPTPFVRQDVGLKLRVRYVTAGDEVLLNVDTELSTAELPAVRKIMMHGAGLASPGKMATLSSVTDDRKS